MKFMKFISLWLVPWKIMFLVEGDVILFVFSYELFVLDIFSSYEKLLQKNDVICMKPLYGTVECYQTSDVKIKSSKI